MNLRTRLHSVDMKFWPWGAIERSRAEGSSGQSRFRMALVCRKWAEETRMKGSV
jgi:hypothetical protein